MYDLAALEARRRFLMRTLRLIIAAIATVSFAVIGCRHTGEGEAGDLLLTLDLGPTSVAVEREQAGVRSAEARVDDLEAGNRTAEIAAAGAEVGDRRAAVERAPGRS